MLTKKQIQLMKLMRRNGEITAGDARKIYRTYNGFFHAAKLLKGKGLIDYYADYLVGKRQYHLTTKGERRIRGF